MRQLLVILLVSSLVLGTQAQQILPSANAPAPVPPAPASAPVQVAPKFALEDGTPVKLRLSRNVSSADAKTGETVDFEVLEEVRVGDVSIVPKGGIAWGTVTDAEPKKRMGRGGKLDMTIDAVRLADSEKVALRGVRDAKGGGHAGAMTAGIVVTGLIVWPAAPFFLFMHGKDITIPKGTEITAYVNGNVPLDMAKFAPQGSQNNGALAVGNSPQLPFTQQATLDISSSPAGAEIELDGNFVGSTPSSVGVPPGDHSIKLTKNGYNPWERKLKTSTGTVKISPELELTASAQAK
jgi:hypothetical protein